MIPRPQDGLINFIYITIITPENLKNNCSTVHKQLKKKYFPELVWSQRNWLLWNVSWLICCYQYSPAAWGGGRASRRWLETGALPPPAHPIISATSCPRVLMSKSMFCHVDLAVWTVTEERRSPLSWPLPRCADQVAGGDGVCFGLQILYFSATRPK